MDRTKGTPPDWAGPQFVSAHTPCIRCGYDLYGSRLGHPCPECGNRRLTRPRPGERIAQTGYWLVFAILLLTMIGSLIGLVATGMEPIPADPQYRQVAAARQASIERWLYAFIASVALVGIWAAIGFLDSDEARRIRNAFRRRWRS